MSLCRFVAVLALVLAVATPAVSDPLVIATTGDATVLANSLAGAGITIVGGSASLTGAATQQGTFTGGAGVLPFNTGVILTTGSATSAPGPNGEEGVTTAVGSAGDAQLSTLAGQSTFDANSLSFSFIPTSDVISFQFVFASDEYHEFVDQGFNDVFAFYLNGTNIALVPGTSTPIAIDTINCTVNSAFYDPNSSSSPCTGPSVNTEYDGLAGGLFAQPLFATGAVNLGIANTLRLAIADAGDSVLDSAVFIAGAGITAQPPPPVTPSPIPEPASLTLLGLGLVGLSALRRRRILRR